MNTPPTTTSAAVPERWTKKQLLLEAEAVVVGRYGTSAVYALFKMIRDDMQARIDELAVALVVEQAQVAELEAHVRALDVLVDWATWQRCLELEAHVAELQSQLDAARAGTWQPLAFGVHDYTGGSVIIDEDDFITRTYSMSLRDMVEGQPDVPPMPFRLCKLQPASAGGEE